MPLPYYIVCRYFHLLCHSFRAYFISFSRVLSVSFDASYSCLGHANERAMVQLRHLAFLNIFGFLFQLNKQAIII